jgi:glycosyltransferase involved in cell wall biosynthesis
VLVPGALGERRTGPEIRAWALACALRDAGHDVACAVLGAAPGERAGITIVPFHRRGVLDAARRREVVLGATVPPWLLAWRGPGAPSVVCDLYDPVELEQATGEGPAARRRAATAAALRRMALQRADLVLCANAAQHAALAAELAALGRGGRDGPGLLVVPFGLPPAPAPTAAAPLRSLFGLLPDTPLVLWWGSVWRWLDAATAVRAIALVRERVPEARLVLTTGRPPLRDAERHAATAEVRELAASLGLLGDGVLLVEHWIPFAERHAWIADADAAVVLHAATAEAPLAARARLQDLLWAGVPVVATRGDEDVAAMEAGGAATGVGARDPAAVADALVALLTDPARRTAMHRAAAVMADARRWPAVTAPLVGALEDAPRAGGRVPVRRVGGFYARRGAQRVRVATS